MRRIIPMVACVLALAVTFSTVADAKKKAKKEEPPPQAAEEMEWIQQGHAAYLIRDFDKALDLYRKAGEKQPKSPAVHYFIGCALRAKGDSEEALESFRTAYLMATGPETIWKGVALIQVALLSEAMGELEEARKAWKDYAQFAEGKDLSPDLTALATKRIEAIDKVLELKKTYEPVRKLIEEQAEKAEEAKKKAEEADGE